MKKQFVKDIYIFAGITILLVAVSFFTGRFCCPGETPCRVPEKHTVRAQGYLRAGSMLTMKNKYAGFVKKVYKYSHTPVKKGDVILEYGDLDIRIKIDAVKHEIEELTQELKEAELNLQLVKLDPLPSEYRNADWKIIRAKEALNRAQNEYNVYCRLFRNHSVSDLDMRSKKQTFFDARAEYHSLLNDKEIISRGLAGVHIALAEHEIKNIKTRIAAKQSALALLLEDQKHYKIVAPRDGVIITNSDTVGAWNPSGTAAAVLHAGKKTLVYSYFKEEDVRFLRENAPARFVSNQSGEVIKLRVLEVKRGRSSYEDGSRMFIKFTVVDDAEHLRLESNGTVEVDFPCN